MPSYGGNPAFCVFPEMTEIGDWDYTGKGGNVESITDVCFPVR